MRRNALESGVKSGTNEPTNSKIRLYKRCIAVKRYVLKRADGKCESCGNEAPFKRKNGEAYLESHHIRKLSDGGLDLPGWVAAICPTCHREIHHGEHGKLKNDNLQKQIDEKERSYNSF